MQIKTKYIVLILAVLILGMLYPYCNMFGLFVLGLHVVVGVLLLFSFRHDWHFYIHNQLSPKTNNGILLTFDDGPHPIYTNLLLDVLKKENIKAVFFCIGKNIETYPEVVSRIHNEGHWIGNHTYSHSISWTVSNKQRVLHELSKVEDLIIKSIGASKKIFRPPFGITNPIIAKACKKLHLKSITWNVRTYDTVLSNETVLKNLNKTLKGNQIVLLHDNREQCTELTKEIIALCKKKNLSFITPDEAIH